MAKSIEQMVKRNALCSFVAQLIKMGYPIISRKVLTLQDEISSKPNGI
jgi:hypothetical protein